MKIRRLPAVAFCMILAASVQAADWPQWRGPDQNGISAATDLPLSWSAEDNVIWKTALPSWSGATPKA